MRDHLHQTRAIGCGRFFIDEHLFCGEKLGAEAFVNSVFLLLHLGGGWQHSVQRCCIRVLLELLDLGIDLSACASKDLALQFSLVDGRYRIGN